MECSWHGNGEERVSRLEHNSTAQGACKVGRCQAQWAENKQRDILIGMILLTRKGNWTRISKPEEKRACKWDRFSTATSHNKT